MSERIRVLVVDDEPLARAGVCELLSRDAELDVVGEAANGQEAVAAITELSPDLVMLDVQMPGMTGFEVIRTIGPEHMPAVVFTTAYDQFAVRAFEVNAVDYLLKPFDDERFALTVARAKKAVRHAHAGELSRRLVELLDRTSGSVSTPTPAPAPAFADRLVVKSGGRVVFLRSDEVDWVEAADYYVKLHTGGKTHLLRETMNALEDRLDPRKFFRVHRSAIVNLDRIRELQPYFRGEHVLILHDGTKLKLSRGRREKLEQMLKQNL
ncbi:MAG: LytR/AlgR family response regulator transcription factor [Longimicrobiales bacterium]